MSAIGVVVLNYMNYELTERCVENIMQKENDIIISIVDNASPNDSFSKLKEYFINYDNVVVVSNTANSGYSAGNNLGFRTLIMRYPEIEFLCVMNPDAEIITPDTLTTLKDVLIRHKEVAVCAPSMLLNHRFIPCDSGYSIIPSVKDIYMKHILVNRKNGNRIRQFELEVKDDNIAYVDYVIGACFMIRKTVLETIGFLDEGIFMYNEETILGIKMKQIGMKVAVLLDLYYSHNHVTSAPKKSISAKLFVEKRGYKSRAYLCKHYYEGKGLKRLYLAHLINVLHLIAAALFHKVLHLLKMER